MQDWLSARAAISPQVPGLIFQGQTWTYGEMLAWAGRLRSKLVEVGVRAGSNVGMLMPNCPEAIFTLHALAQMGCTAVPLNTRLTADEMNWQLHQAGVSLLLYTAKTAPTAEALNPNRLQIDLHKLPDNTNLPPPFDVDTCQAVVFTSGTTGHPKGAEITFNNHYHSAIASALRVGHIPGDRWLSVLPVYHVGGMAVIFRSALYGITTVLHDSFDPEAIQHSFNEHNITMISLVPTMLYRLLEIGTHFPASLRLLLLGGAAAPPALLQQAAQGGLPLAPTYGLTEACSQVATMPPTRANTKLGSVGKPLFGTQVRILRDDGTTCQPGEHGEVVVQGPTIMRGYHNNPDATAKTLKNGLLHTGDIGYLDDDGDLWLVQRRSDLIVSGGENVYPAEVENVLLTHPGVAEVCVVGITHPEWGQQVCAAVVTNTGHNITSETLATHARGRLAGYKIPRRWIFVEHLPQTASGKVKRNGVRQLFDQG